MLQQENLADKELVVGSLKVLGSMSGGGTEKVRENIEMLQNTVKTQAAKTENYWESLTKDGIISPIEKKQLKKEYEGIDQTHTVLLQQAEAKGIDMSKEVIEYDTAFEELKNYLFVQLQLFQKMTESTTIESAEVFNSYYNTYFNKLQNAQARVTIGEPGKIRVISSLLEPGTDGEVVLYENNFYMYDMANHEWIGISVASKVGEYAGVRTDSPPQLLNMFFLVGPGGITEDFIEFTTEARSSEDNAWTDENGNIIFINYGFEEGYIYFWNERNEFEKVEDKNNWRYIVAMNDMIACGFEVSPQLYEWLTGELAEKIGEETIEKTLEVIPQYDRVQDVPQNPNNGDFILWDAPSTARFTKGHLYIYQKATVEWIELNPLDKSGAVREKFMRALADILEVNPTETGYFSTVFAGAFFSNTATINSLSSKEITITNNGLIKSSNFVTGETGWIIRSDGHAEFSDIEINAGYATSDELYEVDQKADAAGLAAQGAKDTADAAEESAQDAKNTANVANEAAQSVKGIADAASETAQGAKDAVDQVTEKDGSTTYLKGEVMQDGSNKWAFRSKGFETTSSKGFGIKNNGDAYFMGTINAIDGIFTGTLNCGSLQVRKATYNGVIRAFPPTARNIDLWNYLSGLAGTSTYNVDAYDKMHFYYGSQTIHKFSVSHYKYSQDMEVWSFLANENRSDEFGVSFIKGQESDPIEVYVTQQYEYKNIFTIFADQLSKNRPSISNVLWNNNGTLSIS